MPLEFDPTSVNLGTDLPKSRHTGGGSGAGRPLGPLATWVRDNIVENPENHGKWAMVAKSENQNSVQSAAQNLRSHFGMHTKLTGFDVRTRLIEEATADSKPVYGLFVMLDKGLIEEGFVYVPRVRKTKAEVQAEKSAAEAAALDEKNKAEAQAAIAAEKKSTETPATDSSSHSTHKATSNGGTQKSATQQKQPVKQ